MNRLSKVQKQRVYEFVDLTNASEKTAMNILRKHDWYLDMAVDQFYQDGGESGQSAMGSQVDTKKVEGVFQNYKEPDEDQIGIDGMVRLCSDLGVDPSDVVMLVLSWKFGAKQACVYTKSEFVGGMGRVGCDSVDALKQKLPQLRMELLNENAFTQIYNYAFDFSKETGQKSLANDMAVGMWGLLLSDKFSHINLWCQFIQEEYKLAISRDTWTMFLDFLRQSKPDYSDYNEDDSFWPTVIDDYISWVKPKL